MSRRPHFRARLFGSPLTRRLTFLILALALAPILFLGALTYRQVTDQLRQQAERRLYQQTKTMAMSIVERLLFVDASLEALSVDLARDAGMPRTVDSGSGPLARRQFLALALDLGSGRQLALHGPSLSVPAVDDEALGHLRRGRMLLRVDRHEDPLARLRVARALDPNNLAKGVLWAEVRPTYLWGLGPENTLPPLAELAVLDQGGFIVHADVVPAELVDRLRAPIADGDARGLRWRAADGEIYLAGRWTMQMATNYAAGTWTVSISRRRSDAMAPLAGFRRTFPQLVALFALIILLIGTRQIRRTLEPLQALRAGTRRIARGDFSQTVKVESGDDMQDLADAFNRMAEVVGRQLEAMETMAAVGRSALTDAASDRIVDILLTRVGGIVPADRARVVLADDAGGWCAFERSPEGVLVTQPALVPAPPADAAHQLSIQMGTDRRAFGWLIVERRPPLAFDDDDREKLVELADLLALALDHLDLRAALDRERHRLEKLVEDLPNGIVVLDAEGEVRFANRLGRSYLSVLVQSEDDAVETVGGQPLASLVGTGHARWHEVELAGPPRRIFIVSVIREEAAPSGTEDGGSVIVLREITDEREAEERSRREERLATVGRLATGISHDFNNMLTGIMMATDLLNTQAPSRETELILSQCRRASDMIGRILDFTRESPHRPADIDLAPVVEGSARLIGTTFPDDTELVLEIASAPLWARADATQIQQVVHNLTINARDAMSETGGRLTISLGPLDRESRPPGEMDRPWLRLAVSDTGPGIPASVRPHIFDPFFTTKELGSGTGLGLAQVLGIVGQHAGQVEVETDDGGTTFVILLPALASPAPSARIVEPVGEVAADSTDLILAVDDDAAVLQGVENGLRQLGYRVITARSGREALDCFVDLGKEIALVLSDVRMPGLDGFALLHRLRTVDPDVAVVLMSGHAKLETDGRAEATGWLRKPFSIGDLSRAIGKALEQK